VNDEGTEKNSKILILAYYSMADSLEKLSDEATYVFKDIELD